LLFISDFKVIPIKRIEWGKVLQKDMAMAGEKYFSASTKKYINYYNNDRAKLKL